MALHKFNKTTGFLALLGLLTSLLFTATAQAESRWYDQAAVDQGATLFKQNCASCHGMMHSSA